MQKIQLLDSKTINKIAAGEVVESPKSVVKELAENAIDAGASIVSVEIREGGVSLIRVTDNGCGIPKEQVKNAFLRHATSKMAQIEDLESIFTLGFRGEALASIAAVAQVELVTKTAGEDTGTKICISGGEVESIVDTACLEGTSITVRNLFYNVPARRKFLKKPATESGYVSDLVNKLALGHPEVSFRYQNNGSTILHTAGNNDPKAAVFYVYGKDAANSMLPIAYRHGEYAVTGLIAKPQFCRANRSYENLFINGRFIRNTIVSMAVEDAYKTKLLIGKFPVFVLNLEVAPALVDVNVHPAKLEVRFRNDGEVYDIFYQAVSRALQDTTLIPQGNLEKKPMGKTEKQPEPVQEMLAEERQEETGKFPVQKEESPFAVEVLPLSVQQENRQTENRTVPPISASVLANGKSVDQLLKRTAPNSSVSQAAEPYMVGKPQERIIPGTETPAMEAETSEEKQPFFKDYRIVGQVFRTYWIVEQGDCLYLIDQHAAHERILYEELMGRFQRENVVSQRLLTPVMLRLTPSETETLRENRGLLESFGFEMEDFSGTFALRAVPMLLREPDGVGFFTEILDRLAEERIRNVYDLKLGAVATMACKAAVKGHDVMSAKEAEALIGRLLELENPFTCPHGRPTIVALKQYDLEKMFKRIQD